MPTTPRLHIQAFFDPGSSTYSYVVDDGDSACAVVDPVLGFDPRSGRTDAAPAEAIARHVEARGLSVAWLLETHVHADHFSAGAWLGRRLGGTLGVGSGITRVQREFRGIFNAGDLDADGAPFGHLFEDGEEFSIGRLQATALHVPGHTPADVAYRIADPEGLSDAVFVGDTLFMPDVGTARCDFPGGDAHVLYRSIARLLALPPATTLHVCHDYPPAGRPAACRTTVAEQRSRNIHARDGIGEEEFVEKRRARDATLPLPALMLPSVQVNMRAGRLPPAESNGTAYLKIPIDVL